MGLAYVVWLDKFLFYWQHAHQVPFLILSAEFEKSQKNFLGISERSRLRLLLVNRV
jgi:hypothetical protein